MLIEIILGERPLIAADPGAEQGPAQAPIQYSIVNEGFRATINGEAVFEPVGPLRERFAKLKARDNLLGAVLARLREDPGASESTAHNAVNRVLNAQAALEKIAKGLGLSMGMYDLLASEVLTMNTELTAALAKAEKRHEADDAAWGRLADAFSLGTGDPDKITGQLVAMDAELTTALSSSQAEVKALTEENARLRAGVEQERGHKLHAMTAADIAISRSAELEAEARILKSKLAEADVGRMIAEATAAGMRTALQHLQHAICEKLRV